MNHQRYGILLFIGLLVLFYLLNNLQQKSIENFQNSIRGDYHEYQSTYLHLDQPDGDKWRDQPLDKCLEACSNDKKCFGVTRKVYDSNNLKGDCYPVYNLDNCQTSHQGSGEERNQARNYKTYLKKSIDNSEHLCLAPNKFNKAVSLLCHNNLYWILEDQKLSGYSSSYIEIDELYPRAAFRIVEGLYGDGTVSFRSLLSKYKDYYVVHNYPKKEQLFIEHQDSLRTTADKARASFRVVRGLNGKGISIRIIQFPEVYLRFENKNKKKDRLIVLPIQKEKTVYDLATFYFHDQIEKTNLTGNVDQMLDNTPQIVTPQEKIRQAKTKNLHTIEKQKALLEQQNQRILDFDFSQANRVSYVGRELAQQASHLELGNYLKEQEAMKALDHKLKLKAINGDNMPNKENFNILNEPY